MSQVGFKELHMSFRMDVEETMECFQKPLEIQAVKLSKYHLQKFDFSRLGLDPSVSTGLKALMKDCTHVQCFP